MSVNRVLVGARIPRKLDRRLELEAVRLDVKKYELIVAGIERILEEIESLPEDKARQYVERLLKEAKGP